MPGPSTGRDLPEMEKKLLSSTQEGIEKIQKIVDDMLHFAKPKAFHFREEELNEVVEKSLAILQTKLKKGNISSVFEGAQGLPKLRIDIHQIQQVLINIMLNAIQAMEDGGTLSVRTFLKDGDGVGIEVRDTGIGIPRAHLKKIFDPCIQPLMEGAAVLLCYWLVLLWMYRRKLFLKI